MPMDYQQLLLLLAEDYINAAHGMGSLVALYRRSEDVQQYYKLIATGLSCLEASLTEFRLRPQVEAPLILQYCTLVFQETDNYDEMDRWLSKAVSSMTATRAGCWLLATGCWSSLTMDRYRCAIATSFSTSNTQCTTCLPEPCS